MSKETRSRGGCWTCRARRKKCDESRPHCSLCLSLGIQCHGYTRKPAWMDGGSKEKMELSALTRKVAKTIQRRKLDIRRFSAQEGSPPPYSSLPSLLPAEPLEDVTAARTKDDLEVFNHSPAQRRRMDTPAVFDSVDGFPEPPNHPSCTDTEAEVDMYEFLPEICSSSSSTSEYTHQHVMCDGHDTYSDCTSIWAFPTPLSIGLSSPFTLEDSSLIIHYFDQLRIWQFRYQSAQQPPFSKDWLLWFMLRNRSLYVIILSLSATDQALLCRNNSVPEPGFEDCLVKQYNAGIQALQVSLCKYQSGNETCDEPLHILLCIIMLMFEDILQGGTGNWSIHLEAALSILEPEFSDYSKEEHGYQLNIDECSTEPKSSWCGSVMTQVMWFHILSSVPFFPGSLKISPELCEKYTTILKSGCPGTDLEDIVGCQNWVVISILSIYSLRDWKAKAESAGPLSLWSLTEKASTIRRDLDGGLRKTIQSAEDCTYLGTLLGCGHDSRYEKIQITIIFARAANVLLNVVTSGAHPCLDEIEREVVPIIEALKNLHDPSSLQYLAWPFCIAGSMARVEHYPFFVGLEQQYTGFRIGVLANATRVVQRCWSLREMDRGGKGVDWSDALESLQMGLLFF